MEEEAAERIWAMMLSFEGYSFCKPHSASYARVSFQAAWLKTHFPAEFMAAVISNQGTARFDADGNGSLSATEAAPMDGLSQVFARADADANGELTQDEYKAWLAANGKTKGKTKAGG